LCAPFARQTENLLSLHLVGKSYGKRPSDLLGLQTEWGAWQLDELCAIVGSVAESNVMNGKPAFEGLSSQQPALSKKNGFRSPKDLVKKKVKIPTNGIW